MASAVEGPGAQKRQKRASASASAPRLPRDFVLPIPRTGANTAPQVGSRKYTGAGDKHKSREASMRRAQRKIRHHPAACRWIELANILYNWDRMRRWSEAFLPQVSCCVADLPVQAALRPRETLQHLVKDPDLREAMQTHGPGVLHAWVQAANEAVASQQPHHRVTPPSPAAVPASTSTSTTASTTTAVLDW